MAATTGRFETREELEQAVIKAYGAGTSQAQIARDCEVSASTVSSIIKKNPDQAQEALTDFPAIHPVSTYKEALAATHEIHEETFGGTEGDFCKFWHAGMLCAVLRSPTGGVRGYVRLPRNHRGYGLPESRQPADVTISQKGLPRPTGGNLPGWWVGIECALDPKHARTQVQILAIQVGCQE